MEYHVVVIGSGIAGLNFAINLAEKRADLNILILDKSITGDCNTKNARGGIASIMDSSQLERHLLDTMEAGCGINNRDSVKEILKAGPDAIGDLIKMGVRFNKDEAGKFDLHLEGGHSERRIFHHKDITGKEILEKLKDKVREKSNVHLLKGVMVLDFIQSKDNNGERIIRGIKAFDVSNNLELTICADVFIIASGGLGQLYKNSSNSNIATGDGIAMAVRAGLELSDMEFIQFHPTALYQKRSKDLYLITEALRGEGAIVCDFQGNNILDKVEGVHHLSPRHKVSLAIKNELNATKNKSVYLDCRSIDQSVLKNNFNSFWKKCIQLKLNPNADLIPIIPAAHYLCGGIKTDLNGMTNVESFFALGECAYTGLHGANRLASNSLLEAMVLSKNCSSFISEINKIEGGSIRISEVTPRSLSYEQEKYVIGLKKRLQTNMETYASLIRTRAGLESGLIKLKEIQNEVEGLIRLNYWSKDLFELRNMLVTSESIIEFSLKRKESIGAFYLQEN